MVRMGKYPTVHLINMSTAAHGPGLNSSVWYAPVNGRVEHLGRDGCYYTLFKDCVRIDAVPTKNGPPIPVTVENIGTMVGAGLLGVIVGACLIQCRSYCRGNSSKSASASFYDDEGLLTP